MFCLNLMRIALELAKENQRLRGAGHQVLPALRLHRRGDEEDGRPRLPALGRGGRLLLRRAALPGRAASRSSACARWSGSSRSTPSSASRTSGSSPSRSSATNLHWFLREPAATSCQDVLPPGDARRPAAATCCAIVDETQMQAAAAARARPRRSSSRPCGPAQPVEATTTQHPFVLRRPRRCATSRRRPTSKIKGGNSNWRGPVWFPTSFLMIESLRKLGTAFGPDAARCPPTGGDGPLRNLWRGRGGPRRTG